MDVTLEKGIRELSSVELSEHWEHVQKSRNKKGPS